MGRYNITDAPQHKCSKQIKRFVKGEQVDCLGGGQKPGCKGITYQSMSCAKLKFKTLVGLITEQ